MCEDTPPNWPIFGVQFSDAQIRQILQCIFPDSGVAAINVLERQKSYNNRIYFCDLTHPSEEDSSSAHVVLKVIGRFFGASKVQNEVACLLLLEKYCPDIPAPRVLAWSEDGSKTSILRNGVLHVLHTDAVDESHQATADRGWVMISKVEGRPLRKEELARIDDGLVDQIASICAAWRTKIPKREEIGNLLLRTASSHDLHGLEPIVSGLLSCGLQPHQSPLNLLQYYDHLFLDKIQKLKTNDAFFRLRKDLQEQLEQFRIDVLPHLTFLRPDDPSRHKSLDSAPGVSVFTHQDFAPRNILVTECPGDAKKLKVTGILDFEFAGFFPEAEEFITCMSRQSSDWDPRFFDLFLSRVSSLGVTVPRRDKSSSTFGSLCDLDKLVENVAPWQLESGDISGEERERHLDEAKRAVIRLLRQFQNSG